jgi:hypothetical protein
MNSLKSNFTLKTLGVASCSVNRRVEKKMKQEEARLDFGKSFDVE